MPEEEDFEALDNIGQELVAAGLITTDQLAVAHETKKNLGGHFGHILFKKGFIVKEQLLEFLKQHLNIPFVTLDDYAVDPEVTKLVPMSLAKKYHFMPLYKAENVMTVAIGDPLFVLAVDELRAALKCRVLPVLAPPAKIDELISKSYRFADVTEERAEGFEIVQYGRESSQEMAERLKEMASGARVVAEVNRIISSAQRDRASDIHIEGMANSLKIRNRIDGLLQERFVLNKKLHLPIVTRIKLMAGMDIAERRVPQDGRVRIRVRGAVLDLRVSTYPTMYGEKVVVRLLSKEQLIGLESLGFTTEQRQQFEGIISRPHGIFLVSGPTGSGKTTTLYAALQRINSQDRNIVSIEDPIENEIAGVNQAQVNPKAGMTFASAIRSILRQDPDVIMVGEIRDRETADSTVRAAITGHLVFSTIHTNTALGCVVRLEDLGVEPFLVSSALIGVMSQRLVRRICEQCKRPVEGDEVKLLALGLPRDTQVFRGKGCKHCMMSGYFGRLGLFELVTLTPELRQKIMARASEDALIEEARKEGVPGLLEVGRRRVVEGLTTVDEVLNLTKEEA